MKPRPQPLSARTAALVVLALAALGLLVLAAPVLASPSATVDGVVVTPPTQDGGTAAMVTPDISGDFVTYASNSNIPLGGPTSDNYDVAIKSLLNDYSPLILPASGSEPGVVSYRANNPRILVNGGDIYVVWTRVTLADPWDQDIMIWQGTYNPVTNIYTPLNDSFPKVLVSGTPAEGGFTTQNNPAIGLVQFGTAEAPDPHVVVAWEDNRDNPGTPVSLIYYMDLTSDPTYQNSDYVETGGPTTAGFAVDATDIMARGQTNPDVGTDGVYWLDERWSFWSDGLLTDTAVWHCDLATYTSAPWFSDSDHSYDNGGYGLGGGPRVTGNGAVWLRRGPYGDPTAEQLFMKAGGGSGGVITPMVRPTSPDAWYAPGTSTAGIAVMGTHKDSTADVDQYDYDISFVDPATHERVPVCNYGWPLGTDPDATANYYLAFQYSPAIGPAPGGYRVVWCDNRDSQLGVDESNADPRLYEAFVPSVTLKPSKSPLLRSGAKLTLTVKVAPNFAGQPVTLQAVKVGSKYGAPVYGTIKTAAKTTVKLDSTSSAGWSWKSVAKGTYYVRVYFAGGTKYGVDGVSTASGTGGPRLVPTVPNYSRVLKIVVK